MNPAQLTPDDPRLTAFILGELTAREELAVREALDADPGLQAVVDELRSVIQPVESQCAMPRLTLSADAKSLILEKARGLDAGSNVPFPESSVARHWRPAWIGLAAAAAVALVAVLVNQNKPAGRQPVTVVPEVKSVDPAQVTVEMAMVPVPGPPDEVAPIPGRYPVKNHGAALTTALAARSKAMELKGSQFFQRMAECVASAPIPKESDFPELRPRKEVAAVSQPSLPLPVQSGVSSLIWISRMIREDGKLPPVNAVRVEEMLNHFAFRPHGTSAVFAGVSLSVETTTCPWRPSALLMLVSFRGAPDQAKDVKAEFVVDPANVSSYRLLGFAEASGLESGSMPTRLPAGAVTSLVIEVEAENAAKHLGSIHWSVDTGSAPTMALVHNPDTEPSDDARFAALVCAYGEWLIHKSAGAVDGEMLAAMAREVFSTNLGEDRIDFLNLVGQSLTL